MPFGVCVSVRWSLVSISLGGIDWCVSHLCPHFDSNVFIIGYVCTGYEVREGLYDLTLTR